MAAIICRALCLPCELMSDVCVGTCNLCAHCCENTFQGCADCCNASAHLCSESCNAIIHCCDNIFGKPFSLCTIFSAVCSVAPTIALIVVLATYWSNCSECSSPVRTWMILAIIAFGLTAIFAGYMYSKLSMTHFRSDSSQLNHQLHQATNANSAARASDIQLASNVPVQAQTQMSGKSNVVGSATQRPLLKSNALHFFLYDPFVAMMICMAIFEVVWAIIGLVWAANSWNGLCEMNAKRLLQTMIGASIIFLGFVGIGSLLTCVSLLNDLCTGGRGVCSSLFKCFCCCIYYPFCAGREDAYLQRKEIQNAPFSPHPLNQNLERITHGPQPQFMPYQTSIQMPTSMQQDYEPPPPYNVTSQPIAQPSSKSESNGILGKFGFGKKNEETTNPRTREGVGFVH